MALGSLRADDVRGAGGREFGPRSRESAEEAVMQPATTRRVQSGRAAPLREGWLLDTNRSAVGGVRDAGRDGARLTNRPTGPVPRGPRVRPAPPGMGRAAEAPSGRLSPGRRPARNGRTPDEQPLRASASSDRSWVVAIVRGMAGADPRSAPTGAWSARSGSFERAQAQREHVDDAPATGSEPPVKAARGREQPRRPRLASP